MKNILISSIIFLAAAMTSLAQPRAIGLRVGASGIAASYQHDFNNSQFLEGTIGMDFGLHKGKSHPGFKMEGTYNFIWARPAWTNKGTWAIYAGPGASIGFVNDGVYKKKDETFIPYLKGGFMFGLSAQVGIEYTFEFPLQFAIDLRPIFGFHISGKHNGEKPKVGYYDNGIYGLAPNLSIRYRF